MMPRILASLVCAFKGHIIKSIMLPSPKVETVIHNFCVRCSFNVDVVLKHPDYRSCAENLPSKRIMGRFVKDES